MSSIGLQGMSGISENTLQFRYQKALKQINKLIEFNRQQKEAVNSQKTQIEQLMLEVEQLQHDNKELDEENNILESKYMELEGHYHELEVYCKELTQKFKMTAMDRQDFDQQIQQAEAKYHEDLENQAVKFSELSCEAQLINQVYQQNLTSLETHTQKIQQLEDENKELIKRKAALSEENLQLSTVIKDKNVDHIVVQLEQANKAIERLMEECSDLKSQQIDLEVMDEKKKFEKYIGFSAVNDPRQNDAVKQLVHQYKKKIKTLEAERKELEQKYKKYKLQASQLVAEDVYLRKINGLERLTEKQQTQITQLIEMYDKQLSCISKENIKLREGYYSLSQKLAKKSMDLEEQEKYINQLKYTTDHVYYENESLKKVNSSLIEVNSDRIKDLHHLQKDITQSESFSMLDRKDSEGSQLQRFQSSSANMKKKGTNEEETRGASMQNNLTSMQMQKTGSPESERKHIPITLSYSNPSSDQGDFKFIQSVNIINGYNVNLGEHNEKAKK